MYTEYAGRRSWGPGNALQNWLLRRILREVVKALDLNPVDTSLLEVGSGTGQLAVISKSLGFKSYTAIEPNLELATITRSKVPGSQVYETYLPEIPKDLESTFQLVIAIHVIEHAKNGYEAREWVESMNRTLSSDGYLVIISPDAIDYKMNFWNIDWSHCFPTTVNNVSQIFKDLNIPIVRASSMRFGSTLFIFHFFAMLLNLLIPTRLFNFFSTKTIGRELGTGLKAALIWGNILIIGQQNDRV